MDEQYYCLTLDDYSAPSFTSFGKAYYGTLPQIKAFIEGLEADEKQRESKAALIAAFREYEAGNHEVTHPVAYQKIPLLEPVKLCGTVTQRLDNYQWEHLNTWRWPYKMRCDVVESKARQTLPQFPAKRHETLQGNCLPKVLQLFQERNSRKMLAKQTAHQKFLMRF